jgi:hypothetical protein
MFSAAPRFALSLLSTILLAACQLGAGPDSAATVTPGPGRAGATVVGINTPYPAPGTAVVPTALIPTAGPVATTAPGPIVVPAPGGPLVGPEWTVLYQKDLNADGKADVVAVKLASGITPGATFKQPGFSAYKGPVLEMVIVQAGANGNPEIQASLTKSGLSVGGVLLTSFNSPAAYMVNVTPGARPLVSIWAINAAGAPQGNLVGLEWNGIQGAYMLFGGLAK